MIFLFGIELGAAKIYQVEVDVVDFGSAQVGTAQVGLPDFFRGLEVLFQEVVGVKAGSASFAGNRAVDEARARRSEMERRALQVGAEQRGALPVNVGQSRA